MFVRGADGVWVEDSKLTASDAAESDQFGDSVSVSGDTIVVGAIFDDDAGSDSGSAYVFEPDLDGDGHGATTDCNDDDALINPDVEVDGVVVDGVDNNCNGEVDEDYVPVAVTFFADVDLDGFGDEDTTTEAFTAAVDGEIVQPLVPSGHVGDSTDCNDDDDTVFPGADEVAGDGVDQDCDGEDTPLDDVEDETDDEEEDDSSDEERVVEPVLSITARVFEDSNRNGVVDGSEEDVSGVDVDLFAVGSDGELGTSDDVLVASATTASPAEFFDIADGAYLLVVDSETLPAGLSTGDGSLSAEVNAVSGSVTEASFAQQFALVEAVLVDSAGVVVADTLVTLTDSAGNTFTATTNSSGEFVIQGNADAPLALGTATVSATINGVVVSVTIEVAGANNQIGRLALPVAQTVPTSAPVLAFTGVSSQWLVGLGLLFLAMGAAVASGRRRLLNTSN